MPCSEAGQETQEVPQMEQGVPVVKRRHARPLELDSDDEEEQEDEENPENVLELCSEQRESKKTKITNTDQVEHTSVR